MNNSAIIQLTKCPNCEYECDRASHEEQEHQPKPQDLSICMKCGQINQFDDELQLVKPRNDFMLILAKEQSEFYLAMLKMAFAIKQADVLNYYKTKKRQ